MNGKREINPKVFPDYDKDAPLRLDTAAKIAFPDGSIGAKQLRRMRDAGKLETIIVARKEYTTLAAVDRMIELCRFQPKERASGKQAANPTTDADTALEAARLAVMRLRNASSRTARKR